LGKTTTNSLVAVNAPFRSRWRTESLIAVATVHKGGVATRAPETIVEILEVVDAQKSKAKARFCSWARCISSARRSRR